MFKTDLVKAEVVHVVLFHLLGSLGWWLLAKKAEKTFCL
jgi:hypothetical protein